MKADKSNVAYGGTYRKYCSQMQIIFLYGKMTLCVNKFSTAPDRPQLPII